MDNLMKELYLIQNFKLRLCVARYLDTVPDYFFTVGASSTGKYHPQYTQGEGGLVRHTKAAVQIANMLLQLEQYDTLLIHRDEIISALIIHDTYKHGVEDTGHTVFEHPILASQKFREFAVGQECSTERIDLICDLVKTHMGRWNKSKYSDVVLEKPVTAEQQFVHLCDYLASRKTITIEV